MKYVSVAEMIAIEQEADRSGHSYAAMMENAGRGLAEVIHQRYQGRSALRALGLVGSGNNGGDTLVAFCYLQAWGWQTTSYIVRPRPAQDPLLARLVQAGGAVLELAQDPDGSALLTALDSHAVVLDGILGTGIRLPLQGEIPAVLNRVQTWLARLASPPPVVAVDCPSGVDCDSGQVAPECLAADLTVTMAAVKQGLLKFPAFSRVGELVGVGIGLPDGLSAWDAVQRVVVDADWVRARLPERPLDAHKGTFGTALVVAGSLSYTGAALLAGQAAYRIGAGLVTLGIPAPLHLAISGHFPEATWLLLPHRNGYLSGAGVEWIFGQLERVTAMLFGPGFGLEDCVEQFVNQLLNGNRAKKQNLGFVQGESGAQDQPKTPLPPLVVDADGLKLLARITDWPEKIPAAAVLTPHPGEMAVLTGLPAAEIQANRLEIVERYAVEWGHIVILKGAHTLIAAPDGRTAVIPVATPALARAGSGDVLAGLVVGLRAQGLAGFEAATAAAWIHAQSGLRAAEKIGAPAAVLAGDVLAAVQDVLADLESKKLAPI